MRTLCAVTAFLLCGAAPMAPKRLKTPGYLPTAARELLGKRMETHGINVMRLSISAILLDYDDVSEAAKNIVAELGVKHVRNSADVLDAALPQRFFDLQNQLRSRAQTLAEVAQKRSAPDMSAAYSRVTETCIACHSVYLNGREDAFDR